MSVPADILFSVFTSGVGRARGRTRFARPTRQTTYVVATPWMTAGMAAITALGVVLVASVVAVGKALWSVADDDIAMALFALIGIPLLGGALSITLSILGWMVGVFRKLVDLDSSARIDLAAAGIGAWFVGVWIAVLVHPLFAVVVGASGLAALVVSIAPAAWHERPTVPLLLPRENDGL